MKKVTLTIVVRDEDSQMIAKMMEDSMISQLGLYTLTCGDVQNLTAEETQEVKEQLEIEGIEI